MPADTATEEFCQKIKLGSVIHADFKKMRNPKFHRKAFALFNLAFQYWQPGEVSSKHGVPEKNFDRFRKDLTILAGSFHNVIRLDGSVRIEADSLSFGSMDEETFDKLYNNVLNVILKKIPILDKLTAEEVNDLVDKVLRFG